MSGGTNGEERMSGRDAGEGYVARWWHRAEDGSLHCDACPRACVLATEGQRGDCHVRRRKGDQIILETYGKATGFCLDPIEKKPLYHFHPGTAVLSLGTPGCNLRCRTCPTWRPEVVEGVEAAVVDASPLVIADAAAEWACPTVAFTYNDPMVYTEYAVDVARTCHVRGLRTVAVTAGYATAPVRRELFGVMDAANVDLKAFDEEQHRRLTGGDLRPVLETLVHVRHHAATWLEISTLLVPGVNDDNAQLRAMAAWIHAELGPDVPLHFAIPRPGYRPGALAPPPMVSAPARAALARAWAIAREAGLRHVYTGTDGATVGRTTSCPGCGTALVEREGLTVRRYRLTSEGRCPECRTPIAGVFDDRPGEFGARRIPVRVEAPLSR